MGPRISHMQYGSVQMLRVIPGNFKNYIYMTDVQWVHVLALMGEASDDVPGVAGVGAEGALSLIQEFGSVQMLRMLQSS